MEKDEYLVNQPIGQIKTSSIKYSSFFWVASDQGKPSTSHFKVLKRDFEKSISICEVTITTGRPHQIRIHSAFLGHPLFNDPLYVRGGGVCEMAQFSMKMLTPAPNSSLKHHCPEIVAIFFTVGN